MLSLIVRMFPLPTIVLFFLFFEIEWGETFLMVITGIAIGVRFIMNTLISLSITLKEINPLFFVLSLMLLRSLIMAGIVSWLGMETLGGLVLGGSIVVLIPFLIGSLIAFIKESL